MPKSGDRLGRKGWGGLLELACRHGGAGGTGRRRGKRRVTQCEKKNQNKPAHVREI